MPTLAIEIDIAAEPEAVFDGLLDTAAFGDWMTAHSGWPDGPPEVVEGASFRQDVRMLGRSGQVHWTVDELEPPWQLVLGGTGPAGLTLRNVYAVEPADLGSTLRCESEFEGGPLPLSGRIGNVMLRKVRAASEESMSNFAALMERSRPARKRRFRFRRRRLRWATNARVVEAIEENTRAIEALREEIARSGGRGSAADWLTAPLDLLRRD